MNDAMTAVERTFVCSDGLKLAALEYNNNSSSNDTKILLLHGWLDNAASFWKMAPSLAATAHVVALDLPGHGKSGHRSPDGPVVLLADACYHVGQVLDLLEWNTDQQVVLIGHSMGGSVALMYTAAYPERVSSLVLLESLGPMTTHVPGRLPCT